MICSEISSDRAQAEISCSWPSSGRTSSWRFQQLHLKRPDFKLKNFLQLAFKRPDSSWKLLRLTFKRPNFKLKRSNFLAHWLPVATQPVETNLWMTSACTLSRPTNFLQRFIRVKLLTMSIFFEEFLVWLSWIWRWRFLSSHLRLPPRKRWFFVFSWVWNLKQNRRKVFSILRSWFERGAEERRAARYCLVIPELHVRKLRDLTEVLQQGNFWLYRWNH